MKRHISLIAAILMVPLLYQGAMSAWNIIQNPDGTTVWRSTKGDTGGGDIEHPVGSVFLTIMVPDVSSASTQGVVSPITRARVVSIRHALTAQITGTDTVYRFNVLTRTTRGSLAGATGALLELTNGTGRLTITACTNTACTEEAGTTDTFTVTDNTAARLEQGSVILINNDGGSTNAVPGIVTIELRRY